jgi:uncharacterized protein YaaQ
MLSSQPVNLLALIFVTGRQAETLMRALVEAQFYFTKIESTGLAFQEQTIGVLIGLNNQRMEQLMAVVLETCPPHKEFIPVLLTPMAGLPPLPMIEARVGGALMYSIEVERFIQI